MWFLHYLIIGVSVTIDSLDFVAFMFMWLSNRAKLKKMGNPWRVGGKKTKPSSISQLRVFLQLQVINLQLQIIQEKKENFEGKDESINGREGLVP